MFIFACAYPSVTCTYTAGSAMYLCAVYVIEAGGKCPHTCGCASASIPSMRWTSPSAPPPLEPATHSAPPGQSPPGAVACRATAAAIRLASSPVTTTMRPLGDAGSRAAACSSSTAGDGAGGRASARSRGMATGFNAYKVATTDICIYCRVHTSNGQIYVNQRLMCLQSSLLPLLP